MFNCAAPIKAYPSIFLPLILALVLPSTSAQAQFTALFGKSIETIETEDLYQKLRSIGLFEPAVADQTKAADAEKTNPLSKSDFVLVDVRSDAETTVSMIPGAITKAAFEKNQSKYKTKLVIPYCTIGGRSGNYAKQLSRDGFRVKNYKGSILAWVDAKKPLVTPAGKPTNRVHTYSDRYTIPDEYEQVTER